MELFSVIKDVATPASLIAFVVAAVVLVATTYLKTRSKRDVDAVKSVPESDRRALIENLWEREGLDRFNPENLTRDQRYDLVLKTLEQRDTRLRSILLAVIAITVVVAVLVAMLILTNGGSPSQTASVPTATPDQPPIIRDIIATYEDEYTLQPTEYTIQNNTSWSPEEAQALLSISSVYSVELESGQVAFDIHFSIKNPTAQSISLILSPSFFTLEDDQGQVSEQIFFCCPAQGTILAPNQERDVRVIFEDLWYRRKYEFPASAPAVSIIVRGLAPVTRAVWAAPLLLALA